MPNDLPPWFAVYQQSQRWLAEGVFEALARDLRALLRVELIYVDQGCTGVNGAEAAKAQGAELCVVKIAEGKKGFVLSPKRWVVERSFAWATRCRRLVKDYERYAQTLAGLHLFDLCRLASSPRNGLDQRFPAYEAKLS